jgi:hypothetical protein
MHLVTLPRRDEVAPARGPFPTPSDPLPTLQTAWLSGKRAAAGVFLLGSDVRSFASLLLFTVTSRVSDTRARVNRVYAGGNLNARS